jgi:hypothetical protein
MKRISYNQMVIGLDQLMFSNQITNREQAEMYAAAINEYLTQCGWDWNSVISYMAEEDDGQASTFSAGISN